MLQAAEQDRPDVAAARKAFRKEQKLLDPKQLVFIDETAATTKMTRLYGRLRKASGSLIRCHTATGKQRLLSAGCAMMASRHRLRWMARWMDPTSWPMSNGFLGPTLKKGQIVLLDNVSTHKVDGVEEVIPARGACAVFLPAYSPDLNPIEQLFSTLKSFLRRMKARTVEQLWSAIASFLKGVSKEECKAYVANSGYT